MDYDLSRSLFSINGTNFSCTDFISALDFYGILDQWKKQTSLGKACVATAEDKSLQPEAEILQRWAREFRYDHNLLSTEDCTIWFASAGLDRQVLPEVSRHRADEVDENDDQRDLDERVLAGPLGQGLGRKPGTEPIEKVGPGRTAGRGRRSARAAEQDLVDQRLHRRDDGTHQRPAEREQQRGHDELRDVGPQVAQQAS